MEAQLLDETYVDSGGEDTASDSDYESDASGDLVVLPKQKRKTQGQNSNYADYDLSSSSSGTAIKKSKRSI